MGALEEKDALLADKNKRIESLGHEVTKLLEHSSKLNNENAELSDQVTKLKDESTKLKAAIAETSRRVEELQVAVDEKSTEIALKEEQLRKALEAPLALAKEQNGDETGSRPDSHASRKDTLEQPSVAHSGDIEMTMASGRSSRPASVQMHSVETQCDLGSTVQPVRTARLVTKHVGAQTEAPYPSEHVASPSNRGTGIAVVKPEQ